MKTTDPLLLRCLALTGSFETGKLPPGCFSSLAGDFDGQGLSFSCLQWNIGQKTLQPLLSQMYAEHSVVMQSCFGENSLHLQPILALQLPQQLGWARSIQGPSNHVIDPDWAAGFAALGATPEWQAIAQTSAEGFFDHARYQAVQFRLKSDRAMALLFDIAVQNGGVPNLAAKHVQANIPAGPDEQEVMQLIAQAIADVCTPRFRQDVLSRKMTIANGIGVVHGLRYDLAAEFAL